MREIQKGQRLSQYLSSRTGSLYLTRMRTSRSFFLALFELFFFFSTAYTSSAQETQGSRIVSAARTQVGKTVIYDPAYVRLDYPGGDVPLTKGVCTDVVIRALRDALDMDLQQLVHEDMKEAFSEYPDKWGLKKPDPNIDHRRVPNLKCYFKRKGYSVGVSRRKKDYLPGDVVTCMLDGNRPHIMIVSDKKTRAGVPLVIHNIGRGAKEEDRLFEFPLTGHYRIKMEEVREAERTR